MTEIFYKTAGDMAAKSLKHRALLPMLLICYAGLFWLTAAASAGPEKVMILFYSAEANINNFKPLKTEFDTYLLKSGNYEFQPFSDRETFEQYIKEKDKCLLFLSSWHYRNIYKSYALNPFLVGIKNGKKHQKRVLVTKSADLKSVAKGTIASASDVQHSRSVLKEILGDETAANSARILTVPKDIDALMSVGFEMSKAALITESALKDLEKRDPSLHKKIKILAEGKASFLPVLAVPDEFVKNAEKVIEIIKSMPGDSNGMNAIKMLGLDGWEPVDPSDKSKLEG
ncbi:hypothetical protein QUF80_18905 [Desulfococcaceae bacterium HSG8]|nr:hypothetical protein [Desulfococcaceae bacterium HSG8]